MKKYIVFIILIFTVGIVVFSLYSKNKLGETKLSPNTKISTEKSVEKLPSSEKPQTNMPNPASEYCEENGGTLEVVTYNEGAQFSICKFEDYSCEEWTYFRDECDIEGDALKIKDALVEKGLNLTGMKVVIYKHLGKDIAGGVVPVDMLGGGGYVFATKDDNGNVKIVADGNGAIMCAMLQAYPGYSTYLIPECIDESGTPITR